VIRQTLQERAEDVTLAGLLVKTAESRAPSLSDTLTICLFSFALFGGPLSPGIRGMLTDSLARRAMALRESPVGIMTHFIRDKNLDKLPPGFLPGLASRGV
jgi:hypothetical protein